MLPKRYPGAIWVESPNFYRDRVLDAGIITGHTTEGSESPRSALWSAQWCARKETGATAHFFVDNKNIYQSVECDRQAWHCNGGNVYSIGVEFAGKASQRSEEWADAFSIEMLQNAAVLYRWLADNGKIPLIYLGTDALVLFKQGKTVLPRGCCAHKDWVRAGFGGNHVDWGETFPVEQFLLACIMTPSGDKP